MTTTQITDQLWSEMMEACKASGISPTQANKAFTTLTKFRALEADAARLRSERDQLQQWKQEAMVVLGEWEAVWEAAESPGRLGQSKSVAVRNVFLANAEAIHGAG